MSEIKAGDLVMVVKPLACCGNAFGIGRVHVVLRIGASTSGRCEFCGNYCPSELAADFGGNLGFELRRLKKIDPPAEGETREAYKNLKVPA